MATSPTARCLKRMRDAGALVGVVERWIEARRIRVDFLGCIDLIAVEPGKPGALGIQACAGASHAARRTKALAEPRLRIWLAAGNRFEVHSFALQGARGKRKAWVCRVEALELADFAEVAA